MSNDPIDHQNQSKMGIRKLNGLVKDCAMYEIECASMSRIEEKGEKHTIENINVILERLTA